MHPGSDPMGAPQGFTARRAHHQHLPGFELPPPPMHKYSNYTASQPSQAPTTIASVGNLLTPPNNIPGDVINPSTRVSTSSASSNAMPHYNQNYIYSPPAQGATQYGYQPAQHQQNQYQNSRGGMYAAMQNDRQLGDQGSLNPRKGLNPPPYEMNQQLPPFPPSTASSNMPTMPAQQHQHQHQQQQQQQHSHHMMNAHPPVSSSAPQQSPVHAQESFHRPPPTPSYYSQPSATSQQSSYPYSTGPSPTQQSPISGSSMPRMSPAVSQGSIPSLPTNPSQSPHSYQRPYANIYTPAPVFSNVANPNGQLSLVNNMHPSQMMSFNSGHAASMPHYMSGHAPHQQPAANDRPFKCDQCPQSFNRNHDLKRHKRIHLAVKPFPCNHCDKSFSRKDALKRHILVKGCGKASNATEDAKRESHSPDHKNENVDSKPSIHT
ncbi:hypothetical protein K504DRAFT_503478 [Pleomassaria siparia CBS 279.74]|uniref:C2H2-type domain-containing protein n=1 Tax=Pleomassaria siparia CBS 279.74 TaxID=1314801 RepID=A0A6G1K779_9PLEO|nr:hypothetical protein K504DRAFT_503478 [Pleomassaria siparia CBS 279.74]